MSTPPALQTNRSAESHQAQTAPRYSFYGSVPAILIVCIATLFAGCARWSPDSDLDTNAGLPRPLRSLDTVVVETVLVRFPIEKSTILNEMWAVADESLFDIQLRERLDNNGIRAGMLGGELPRLIREQIHKTSLLQNTDALEHAGLAADVDNKMRKMQCRAGRRKDVFVRPNLTGPLTVLTTQDGRSVTGATYEHPSVLFALKAIPHGDGQATIELTPEIQHGQPKQAFVRTEFGVRPEARRDQKTWQDLMVSARMDAGQVLMIAGTYPPKALGSAFFKTKTVEQTEEHVVLLVRLAETQLDELFAPEEIEQAHAMAER